MTTFIIKHSDRDSFSFPVSISVSSSPNSVSERDIWGVLNLIVVFENNVMVVTSKLKDVVFLYRDERINNRIRDLTEQQTW
ncbi:hypothetical protein TNCV_3342571 [Trichonephila clavipes]|nr:hypothetical protein TNCV_3342571 [Trichonephila clavipes]